MKDKKGFTEKEKEVFAKAKRLIESEICKKYSKDNCKKCPVADCNFLYRLTQISICGA